MSSASDLIRAVIDSNTFVSGLISPTKAPFEVLEALQHRAFMLVISHEQQREIEDILLNRDLMSRYGISRERVELILGYIRNRRPVPGTYPLPVSVRDSKDDAILATALAGNADYLVTGDADLPVLADDPRLAPLQIVTPRAFIEVLDAGQ